jgi:glycosyltransferase involved in cell wall biosynthesis
MKVLILGSKEYPLGTNKDDNLPSGGIETFVEGLALKLSKTPGINIIIITRKFSMSPSYEKRNNVEIYRVGWIRGFYFRNITFNFMAFLKALRLDFEIIHAHGPISTFFGVILSMIKRAPIIATTHGLALKQPQYNRGIKKLFAMLERFAYSSADCVIFLSDEEKEGFRKKLGFLPDGYKIIPPGMDSTRFASGDGQKIREEFLIGGRTVITFIGRLIEVKGIKYLIEATRDLKGDFLLLIVGDGPQKKELKAMVSGSKVENLIFTGQRSDVTTILAATDIFVLPSLSEGLPTALLEAMAAGKACVVTDIGLPVEDEKTGLVVKKEDSEELRAAIKRLMSDQKLRNNLGKRAKKDVIQNYDWGRVIDRYVEVFTGFKAK